MNVLKILDVTVTNEEKENILKYFFARIKGSKEKTFIITPNPEMLAYASRHLDYKNKLNSSTIALPDGIGLFFASGMMGESLRERITGVDFIEDLCLASKDQPLSMGFLGAGSGVAKRTAECLLKKYPYLNIVFAGSEWNEAGFRFTTRNYESPARNATHNVAGGGIMNLESKKKKFSTLNSQLSTPIDILFVAYGVPKQEEWIYENLKKLPVKAMMGVGGAFDYISGDVHRAPFILRYAGFEWLFRLIAQPWRWRRQLALVEFIILVFKENFSKTS